MYESSGQTASESTSDTPTPTERLWIPEALSEMSYVLQGKNADYRLGGEFSNFEYAAHAAGISPAHVMIAQIGIKLGRLIGLTQSSGDPNNEAVADTIMDLHGYAAILHAWSMKGEAERRDRDEDEF